MRQSLAIIFLFLVGSSHAATLYTYQGNNYTNITDGTPPAGTYTASMNVTASFIVAGDLTEMAVTDISGMILEYSFFDGRNTLTQLNSVLSNASFAVNAGGEFSTWNFGAFDSPSPSGVQSVGEQELSINTNSSFIDSGAITECTSEFLAGGCATSSQDVGAAILNPGTWVKSTVVPLPAAVWLFGSGLGLLGWLRRKQSA